MHCPQQLSWKTANRSFCSLGLGWTILRNNANGGTSWLSSSSRNLGGQCTHCPITADLWHRTHTSKHEIFLFQQLSNQNIVRESKRTAPLWRIERQKVALRWEQREIVVVYMKYFFGFVFVPPTDSKGLSNPSEVEALREKVYASLEAYCKQKYPEQPGRYGDKWNCARPQTVVFREKRATHTYLEREPAGRRGVRCVFTFSW